jgi:septin family protein
MQRYAIMFRVRPETQDAVRELLSTYSAPEHVVDESTRLVSTSVFLKDGLIVRMIEIEGSIEKLMAHMSKDPSIQYVERELDKYLVEEDRRKTNTPDGARAFFQRVLMETVTTRTVSQTVPAGEEVSA